MNVEAILKYPFIFFLAFLVTFLATPVVRALARRLGIVDLPGGRRIHEKVIPRAGGVAVFLGFHAGAIGVFFAPWLPFAGQIEVDWFYRFLLPSSLLLLLGLADDWKGLSPIVKLVGQVVVALVAISLDMRMGNILGVSPPLWLDVILTLGWFLILINAFNLIDGLDGLATGLALVAATGIALSLVLRNAPGDVLLLLAFAGACLAFLKFNFYPASIFLGDSGSMFLGFTLAALALSTQSKGPALAVVGFPLVAMGIPLIDTLLAIWRRSLRGSGEAEGSGSGGALSSLATADEEHLHHRFVKLGFSQRRAALSLYGLAVGSTVVGLLLLAYRSQAQGILLISFVVVSYVMCRHLAWVELRESGAAVLRGLSRPTHRNASIIFYPILDVLVLVVSLAFAIVLCGYGAATFESYKGLFLKLLPVGVGIPMLALVKIKAYSRIWSMARISEILLAGIAAAAGGILGFGIYILGGHAETRTLLLIAFTHAGLSLTLVAGNRSFVRVIQDLMGSRLLRKAERAKGVQTLLVGHAGEASIFLRGMGLAPLLECRNMEVVGLIDEDRNVQGRMVHGFPVLGSLRELASLLDKTPVQQVVIVGSLGSEEQSVLKAALQGRGIMISRWINELETHVTLS